MNKFIQSTGMASLLMVILIACQNDTRLPEPSLGSARLGETNGEIQPGLSKKYTLLSEGATTLSYEGQEIPMKELFSPESYRQHSLSYDGDFFAFYDIQVLLGSGKITRSGHLYTDAKGRCYKSDELVFPAFGPALSRTYQYTYNDKNQLVQRVNVANVAEKAIYSYDDQGDLIQVDYLDPSPGNGAAPNKGGTKLTTRVQLSYEPFAAGDGKTVDLGHLNPEFDPELDRYLRIYGTFSKHLVHRITILHPSTQNPNLLVKFSDHYFSYTLNSDGYVTQRQRYEFPSSVLLATDAYTYKVTTIGLNP
ncbi:hypothetical protein [Spirosoma gilvum]